MLIPSSDPDEIDKAGLGALAGFTAEWWSGKASLSQIVEVAEECANSGQERCVVFPADELSLQLCFGAGEIGDIVGGAGAITPLGSWDTEDDSRARLWLLVQPSRSSLSDIWEANQLWLDRTFCALSSGPHDDDVWCIDPRGVLTLCLCKETYEILGLVGKKLPFKGCPERYGSYSFYEYVGWVGF